MSLEKLTVPVASVIGAIVFAISMTWTVSERLAVMEAKLDSLEKHFAILKADQERVDVIVARLERELCRRDICPN